MADRLGPGLLRWGAAHHRDLPWRRTRDPWAVLVSEVMTQQTQVARVVPRYEAFLERWPTPAACAAASLAEVLTLWSGLGYPRRARSLWSAASVIVEQHEGRAPDRLDLLLALPGVGDYTARAVLAFAFERDVGVVDTNIARVLARCAGRPLTRSDAQRRADEMVGEGTGWAHNQALMDLGAELCRPLPRCGDCPLRTGCRWFVAGRPEPDPAGGSHGVSRRQPPFEGSDRQVRGRILRMLTHGGVARLEPAGDLGGIDPSRVRRLAESLVEDGLASWSDSGELTLPASRVDPS
ncbi:MAG: A/G-specific adenine glycosylase [Microthrixaceae bacterium]